MCCSNGSARDDLARTGPTAEPSPPPAPSESIRTKILRPSTKYDSGPAMTPVDAAIATAIGALVGILPGLFGVGGGFLMVPLLNVFAGVPMHVAIGSCACTSLGSVTTGMLHRRSRGPLPWRLPLVMLPATMVGLEAGIVVLEWTKRSTARWTIAGREVPLVETTQLVCYLGIMLVLAAVVALETYYAREIDEHARRGWLEGVRLPPYVRLPEIDGRRGSLVVVSLLGLVVGVLNGGFGMGGAILLVPGLVFLVGVPTHRAVAVTLVSSFLAGFVASGSHAARGNVDLVLTCWLLLGATLGARIGSSIAARLTGRRLRRYFALVILASTSIILWRLYALVAS
jgi:uncharacterized protein